MRSAIVLAAGKGTRMHSNKNKVMHEVMHKPMIAHIVKNLKLAKVEKIVIIVGHQAKSIQDYFKDECLYALQEEQLGTGHAVMQASVLQGDDSDTIVLCGDGPCIQQSTIEELFEANEKFDCSVVTSILEEPKSYGRIVRSNEQVAKIVEAKDCSNEQLAIKEINTGIFCFKTKKLFECLPLIKNNNIQHEYYLTDLVEIFNQKKYLVNGVHLKDNDEAMGVNDRIDLSKAQEWMKKQTNERHMRNGVTLLDPNNAYIDTEVVIGKESEIEGNVTISGDTKIGERVKISSGSVLINAIIEDDAIIVNSRVSDSVIKKKTTLGPNSHIRNGCVIGENCRIGNFVEMKNTNFGDGSKCAHLTYLGDSDFGKNINVGCGVVTVNYDGVNKHRTTVLDGAFIGSNCNLIAPLIIGKDVVLAAGSTITMNVEDEAMGIARSRQENKAGFGKIYKSKGKKRA